MQSEEYITEGTYRLRTWDVGMFLLLSVILGIPFIAFGINGFFPDKYGATYREWGTVIIGFGLMFCVFFQTLYLRKVKVKEGKIVSTSLLGILKQKFVVPPVEDSRTRHHTSGRVSAVEIRKGMKWNMLLGNRSFYDMIEQNQSELNNPIYAAGKSENQQ